MAIHLRQRWEPKLNSGMTRRDRRGCDYDAYLPDPLSDRSFLLDGDVAADVADAEAAVIRFNQEAQTLINSEALARLLLRTEAVASSKIEGLHVGPRRLLRAQAASAMGADPLDINAKEILANIDAMAWSVEEVATAGQIRIEHLLEMHRRLLGGTRLAEHAGRLRQEQNWIGGGNYNPCGAAFVPPPPEEVSRLLEDLCAFCNDDSLSPIVQAAIAHTQFETIHPFVDGNGRAGRALIHVILRRRGLAPRILPPVSLVLATRADDYVNALTATRYLGSSDSTPAREGINRWTALFAGACNRAVQNARLYEQRTEAVQQAWLGRLGRIQARSATALLLAALPSAPVLSVGTAAELIGRTYQAANEAVSRLVEANVLRPVTIGKRNRAFEATELIDALAELEAELS